MVYARLSQPASISIWCVTHWNAFMGRGDIGRKGGKGGGTLDHLPRTFSFFHLFPFHRQQQANLKQLFFGFTLEHYIKVCRCHQCTPEVNHVCSFIGKVASVAEKLQSVRCNQFAISLASFANLGSCLT